VAQFKRLSQNIPEDNEEITSLGASKDGLECKDFPFVQNPFFSPWCAFFHVPVRSPWKETHIFVFRLCDGSVLTLIAFCLVRNRQCMSVLWLP